MNGLSKMNRSYSVYKKIRDSIIKNELQPGERLIESELSRKFDMSRGPIRQAFCYLEKDGYINVLPNKGAIVGKINSKDVRDYYALLSILEGKAVEWSFPNLNQDDIQKLVDINNSTRSLIEKNDKIDIMKWTKYNLIFHGVFWKKSGNEKLPLVITDIRKRLFRYRYWSIVVGSYEFYCKEHEEIIAHPTGVLEQVLLTVERLRNRQ